MKDWRTIAEGVPQEAVGLMAQQLTEFGAEVWFTGEGQGQVKSVSGVFAFRLEAGRFDVKLEENPGHSQNGCCSAACGSLWKRPSSG